MNKFIEILAITLGGLSLFAVCLVVFASMSGKPVTELPVVGKLLVEPHLGTSEGSATTRREEDATRDFPATAPRTKQAVVEANVGVLGTWSLPSPYTSRELASLADQLKDRLHRLEERETALDTRERDLDEERATLDERHEVLERMRLELEGIQQDLELRELEIRRDEDAATQRAANAWSDRAMIFEGLDKNTAGTRMLEFEPEEAARILRALDDETATRILQAIPDRWKEYVDAYAACAPAGEQP